jgi:hypothetical protein
MQPLYQDGVFESFLCFLPGMIGFLVLFCFGFRVFFFFVLLFMLQGTTDKREKRERSPWEALDNRDRYRGCGISLCFRTTFLFEVFACVISVETARWTF